MKKNKLSRRTVSLILLALVIVVMLTTMVAGNLLAKYATSAESDVHKARTAKFNVETVQGVTEYTTDVSIENIKPGYVYELPIQVTNNSEVAVECTLTAIKTNNLPLVFKVDGEIMDPPIIKGRIPVGGDDYEPKLVIEWPEEFNDISYSMMVDSIKLSLSVIQID